LPPFQAIAKAHVREALRAFALTSDARAAAAVKHLVGRVLVRASDKAQDLDDGRQHDAAEFLLRLLSNGLDAAATPAEGGAGERLRWRVPAGRFSFEEVRALGAPAPAGASAIVAHEGYASSGHYTGYVALPGGAGWRAVSEGELGGRRAPGGAKIAFFSAGLAPRFELDMS